jgi:hypothetical protein
MLLPNTFMLLVIYIVVERDCAESDSGNRDLFS